jgi:hypothetical protein
MSTEFEFDILENVTFPAMKRSGSGGPRTPRESKYPFASMDVGNMVIIPGKTTKSFGPTVRAAEKKTGFFFQSRTGPVVDTDENGDEVVIVPEGAVGVLRVASKPERKTHINKAA